MEPIHKAFSLFSIFLCCLALLGLTEAASGNCTEGNKEDLLETCEKKHLQTLKEGNFFEKELGSENFYKDPMRFVENPNLCDNVKEAANYMECSIKVFDDCATNSSLEDAHTSPENARKAVEKFCEDINTVRKDDNSTSKFADCVQKHKKDVTVCVDDYVILDEDAASEVCTQHETYTTCISHLDECGGSVMNMFSTFANMMTPQKCVTGAGSNLLATLSTLVTALMVTWMASIGW